MRHNGVGRLWLPLLAVAVVLVVWLRTTGTEAAFAVTTKNTGNTFTAAADWKPPIISRAIVLKTEGGMPGYIRQGGTYKVIATVVDDPSSNPPAGIGSVKGNVGTLTTNATSLTMAASAQTVNAVSFTHASTVQTANGTLAATSYGGSVTSSDLATPVNTSAAFPFSVIVDNTAPTPVRVVITNGGGSGGLNKVGPGDTIAYTWTEPIDPGAIVSGWDGTTPTNVTVQFVNHNKGTGGDWINILDAAADLTPTLPLGTVQLGDTGYVAGTTTFGGPGNSTKSTMTWNQSTSTITVTLGAIDPGGGSVSTPNAASSMKWLPSSGAFDFAGNASTTGTWTESATALKF